MAMWQRLKNVCRRCQIDAEFFAALKGALLEADIGPALTTAWLDAVRPWKRVEDVQRVLREQMLAALPGDPVDSPISRNLANREPTVILLVGVNGVGKTTTLAKLAHHAMEQGLQPLLVAADTFRAAATPQLQVWGDRLRVPVIAQQSGADAAAVAFDGVKAAQARGADLVLIDTAGRLHTKAPLMDELAKVTRVLGKALPGAPHHCWCVLDAMIGQNTIAQVHQFHASVHLTGLIITKLDSTAKAGAVFALAQQLAVPIRYCGVGERLQDLQPFQATTFVDTLIASALAD